MSQVTENPKGGCVLAGINSVLGAIDRVCPIYHSGPGCCMQTTAADQGQSGHKSSRFVSLVSLPSTNMLEKEVVFGGTEKLRTTVQGAIDIIDADAYFVLTGCTAGIIGDDIVSVTEEFQDKGYSVYPIETPGFVGDSNLGYETVWTTMINQVIEEDVPKDDKLVNIFGIIPYHDPFWSGALEEIDRILSALGLNRRERTEPPAGARFSGKKAGRDRRTGRYSGFSYSLRCIRQSPGVFHRKPGSGRYRCQGPRTWSCAC